MKGHRIMKRTSEQPTSGHSASNQPVAFEASADLCCAMLDVPFTLTSRERRIVSAPFVTARKAIDDLFSPGIRQEKALRR